MSRLLPVLPLSLLIGCGPASAVLGPWLDAGDEGPGGDDTGDETVPESEASWLREEVQAPGSITFTELLYNQGTDADLEWIELYNPMVLDMDLSGWRLGGGVAWSFPEGTVLAAGAHLVIAADPERLEEETGFALALGPYDGDLDDAGERIELVSIGGRLIDTVGYGEDAPWPVHADGSGFTLAKRDADAASDRAEHWTVSVERGGTPGADNGLDPLALPAVQVLVADDATWTHATTGDAPDADWAGVDFDDSDWPSGQAPFFAGEVDQEVEATAFVTADNYFALYRGAADGSGLSLVGEDTDGSWTSVEAVDFTLGPEDHLYLAAWELTGDAESPQMVIGEVALPDDSLGTDASAWEWVLGPANANPGALPAAAPPSAADIADLVESANLDASWAAPGAEAGRSSSPWGGSVGGSFTDAAAFIWGDTFDGNSVTNADDTFALFRTMAPVVAPAGNMELSEIPTTAQFRTVFSWEGSTLSSTLHLDCEIDDGAVLYLNGEELHRENLPAGALTASTLASGEADALSFTAVASAEALVQGDNVLAVELHQAEAVDSDLLMGCALSIETTSDQPEPVALLNEVSPSQVELLGVSLTETEARLVSTAGEVAVDLPAPGELGVVEDLSLEPGEVLFLTSTDGAALYDAVRIGEGVRARDGCVGSDCAWYTPAEETPGAANRVDLTEDIVINEILYHRAPLSGEGEPFAARTEEWIELFNRGEAEVDLSGWALADAVSYALPEGTVLAPGAYLVIARDAAALQSLYPNISVVGDYRGGLDNGGDRVLLLDAVGNPADEVRYVDGGRWPRAADGGGSSLELRDPFANNAAPEAWAASDESARAEWTELTIRGEALASAVGPDGQWEELVLGLLDQGEVLIDDLSVVRDPDGAAAEILQNGSFDGGAAHWRLLGNHRQSEVVPDPDDASNPVLRLVATGPTGHMHNHAETTLLEDIGSGEYEISFRARWVSGSNQLHSRLYFNRLPVTTLVPQPERSGTPGEPNSVAEDNIGPTFSRLQQDVAVPDAGEPLILSVSVHDPDGVDTVRLWSSVDGGAFGSQAMSDAGSGLWEAELEAQEAGALVQIYVEATDLLGASATLPAGGADARALIQWDDGLGGGTRLHDLRILMTEADSDWLHEDVNLMSDDLVGATVVYGETEVFYDVGVRLKGSQRGRPTTARLGYGLRFPDDQPFRGSHTSVMIDRSEGVGYGQREVLLNLVMTRAGSVSGEYNDLVQLLPPKAAYRGSAELQLDRYSDLVLASQFADGASGTRYEYELIYYPYTTENGAADGLKLPQPDSVVGTAITDLGDDREAYRWNHLIKNNAREDNYDAILGMCEVWDLSDQAFLEEVDSVIDVEQWLRAFAFATLSGATDQYGGAGSQHNAQFYVRPEDGRMLYFPHDLDYFGSSTMAVVGNGDLARLLQDPANLRSYYGHLNDIIETSYNLDYLEPWCEQLGALLPAQAFDDHCAFIEARAAYVWNGSSSSVLSTIPAVDFQIRSEGADLRVEGLEATLEGEAWVDVRELSHEGSALALTWLDEITWQVTVSVEEGDNDVVLVATDLHGAEVGSDSVVVHSTGR